MIARLYSNENFPLPVVIALRELGHDVLTSLDAGKDNETIPDDELLQFAIEHERAVLTYNRHDFIRLHRLNPAHAGVIVCTENPDFPALAGKIHGQLHDMDSLRGERVRINLGSWLCHQTLPFRRHSRVLISLLMDALTLEQEALKLTPLSRIRLADLLYTSLEVEADREWNRKAIAECESRYEAYKNGEMGSSDALAAIETLRTKFVK